MTSNIHIKMISKVINNNTVSPPNKQRFLCSKYQCTKKVFYMHHYLWKFPGLVSSHTLLVSLLFSEGFTLASGNLPLLIWQVQFLETPPELLLLTLFKCFPFSNTHSSDLALFWISATFFESSYNSYFLTISVNQEFQVMAMLEGHELEKELLSIVSISHLWLNFPQGNLFIGQTRPRVRVQLICNWDKEVGFWVSLNQHTPSQLIFNIIGE